jgi:CMP-N-acetylneuraminic acid synthetase
MIVALLTGRGGSKGIPNKNIMPVLGKPMMSYPLNAANKSKYIDKVFVSTDSPDIAKIGEDYGAETIWRPDELCTDDSLHEEAIAHGYNYLVNQKKMQIDIIVVLLCNCVTILSNSIDDGIEQLQKDLSIDSCVTVSEYSEYNVARAMKIENDRLRTFLPQEELNFSTCDRKSMGPTYFCDSGAYICRPRCMDLSYGIKPFRWMGKEIKPIIQKDGLDVDNMRGLAIAEYWLKTYNKV